MMCGNTNYIGTWSLGQMGRLDLCPTMDTLYILVHAFAERRTTKKSNRRATIPTA